MGGTKTQIQRRKTFKDEKPNANKQSTIGEHTKERQPRTKGVKTTKVEATTPEKKRNQTKGKRIEKSNKPMQRDGREQNSGDYKRNF